MRLDFQAREKLIEGLRVMLADTRKEKDAVITENQNLKTKRAGSTSPPPSQVKLLVRPQLVAAQQ
jgi:hypothetical protein